MSDARDVIEAEIWPILRHDAGTGIAPQRLWLISGATPPGAPPPPSPRPRGSPPSPPCCAARSRACGYT